MDSAATTTNNTTATVMPWPEQYKTEAEKRGITPPVFNVRQETPDQSAAFPVTELRQYAFHEDIGMMWLTKRLEFKYNSAYIGAAMEAIRIMKKMGVVHCIFVNADTKELLFGWRMCPDDNTPESILLGQFLGDMQKRADGAALIFEHYAVVEVRIHRMESDTEKRRRLLLGRGKKRARSESEESEATECVGEDEKEAGTAE